MEKLSDEKWNELSKEEQDTMLEESPETVPDSVKSAVEGKKKDDVPEGNRVKEAERKLRKELEDKHKEEMTAKEEELSELKEQNVSRNAPSEDSYYVEESKRLEEREIYKSPAQLRAEDSATAKVYLDIQRVEKAKTREVNKQIRKLDADDVKLFGKDTIQEEIDEMYPDTVNVPANAAENALIFLKGKNSDSMLKEAAEALEKKYKAKSEGREIVGEDDGDLGEIPSSGSSAPTGNKQGTAKQRKMADMRGISVESQIKLDDKAEKRKKEREGR